MLKVKGINEAGIKTCRSRVGRYLPLMHGRVAGTPIGGVIEGGKNPGGQMLTLTTDDNGEFSFDAAESREIMNFRLLHLPEKEWKPG